MCMSLHRAFTPEDNITLSQKMTAQPTDCLVVEEFQFLRHHRTETNVADIDYRSPFLNIIRCMKLSSERPSLEFDLASIYELLHCRDLPRSLHYRVPSNSPAT